MKRFTLIVFVLAAAVCISGCSKKTESLEDMQQPMSPEDLSRLTSQNETAVPAGTPTALTPVATPVSPSGELEALPPSGPYRPTATEIQTALKNAGYYAGSIDGKIGPKTKAAIEEFQKASGLTADGKVGPKTWQALGAYLTRASSEAPAAQ
jgi:peptidoglycan hydrolase-like protein with peptidoglycan-binding domain